MRIYTSVVADVEKSKERQQIETFAVYIACTCLLYMNNIFSFWVDVSTLRSYCL
jgi:hypothetical protein